MSRRHYASAASSTELATGCNGSAVALTVASVIGYPLAYPWVGIIDRDTALEEVVLVTAGAGTSLTVVRGYDSTAGLDHSIGATFHHGVSAIEFDEANLHINSTAGVHGAVGAVVGTSDTQPLTNKDLSSATNTFPAALATDAEVTAAVSAAVTTLSATDVANAATAAAATALKADSTSVTAGLALKADAAATTAALAVLTADVAGIQAGTLTATAINGTVTTAVVFPTAYGVGVTPVVVVSLGSAVVSTREIGFLNVTNTGFDINLTSNSTTGVPVSWIAVAP